MLVWNQNQKDFEICHSVHWSKRQWNNYTDGKRAQGRLQQQKVKATTHSTPQTTSPDELLGVVDNVEALVEGVRGLP